MNGPKNLKSIQDKVTKLTNRLENNKRNIDKRVAFHIQSVLSSTSIQIDEIKNCTEDQKETVKNCINQALQFLENTSTYETKTPDVTYGKDQNDWKKHLQDTKDYTKKVRDQIKNNQIEPHQCEEVLITSINYFQQFDKFPRSFMKEDVSEVKQSMSTLIVDLFVMMAAENLEKVSNINATTRATLDSSVSTNISGSIDSTQQTEMKTINIDNKEKQQKLPQQRRLSPSSSENPKILTETNNKKKSSTFNKKGQQKSKETTSRKENPVPKNKANVKNKPKTKSDDIVKIDSKPTFDLKKSSNALLMKIKEYRYKLESQTSFQFLLSKEEYQRRKNEVIGFQRQFLNYEENEHKMKLEIEIKTILEHLDKVVVKHEQTNDSLELFEESMINIGTKEKNETIEKYQKTDGFAKDTIKEWGHPLNQNNTLQETKSANKEVEVNFQKNSVNKEQIWNVENNGLSIDIEQTKKKINNDALELVNGNSESTEDIEKTEFEETLEETATTENSVKILDLQQHLQQSQFDDVNIPRHSVEFIEEVRRRAETFKEKVEQHRSPTESVEYFIIDENLMRLVEELDKIKCQDDQTLHSKKIETLIYIADLQKQLDMNSSLDETVLEGSENVTNDLSFTDVPYSNQIEAF